MYTFYDVRPYSDARTMACVQRWNIPEGMHTEILNSYPHCL